MNLKDKVRKLEEKAQVKVKKLGKFYIAMKGKEEEREEIGESWKEEDIVMIDTFSKTEEEFKEFVEMMKEIAKGV